MTGELFGIKRFAVHDGPGIRCTAFLKGCPLRCIWCHNPEGVRKGTELGYLPLQCIRCGDCVTQCPHDVIRLDCNGAAINRTRCTRCGVCADGCPAGALFVKGRTLTAAELIEECSKEEVFFQSTGGGITLSGGDPLFQPEFTAEVLRMAKGKGYHTAVETCLYATKDVLDALIELPDLWIVDLKIWDDKEHQKLTGQTNQQILRNYERLIDAGKPLMTRIPIIPGCTDSKENLVSLGQYIAKQNPGSVVEPMFYNPLAESKYKNYDMPYSLFDALPYTAAQQQRFRAIIATAGINVI